MDAGRRGSVNLAASAAGAVDRCPAEHPAPHDLSFCAAPTDVVRTYVKRDPIIVLPSVVAFATLGPEGAERWQYSLGRRLKVVTDWTGYFYLIGSCYK